MSVTKKGEYGSRFFASEHEEKRSHRFKPDPRRKRVQTVPVGASLTKQSFKDECDVNLIVARHAENGTLEEYLSQEAATRPGRYGDFSETPDFQSAQQIIIDAQAQFSQLPAKTRERFHNDPIEFMEFIHNEENIDEAIKMGLIEREPVKAPPEPSRVIIVDDPGKETKSDANTSRSGSKEPKKTDR